MSAWTQTPFPSRHRYILNRYSRSGDVHSPCCFVNNFAPDIASIAPKTDLSKGTRSSMGDLEEIEKGDEKQQKW
jgi:hypothetical protein